jgi:hypothetical protein
MEAERMLHPINQIGRYTKRSGKEEKITFDNSPYGQICRKKNIFKTIRTVGQQDQWIIRRSYSRRVSSLQHKKFYMPNNAVLVVAGDFKLKKQNNGFKILW